MIGGKSLLSEQRPVTVLKIMSQEKVQSDFSPISIYAIAKRI